MLATTTGMVYWNCRKEIAIFLLAVFHSSKCLSLSVADHHYNVTISTFPQEGPFPIGTQLTLQCHVDPPSPSKTLSFVWRSSFPYSGIDHEACITRHIIIPHNHPRYVRYFCLAVMEETIVGLGSIVIEVRGLPFAVGPTNLLLSTGDSAKLEVEEAPGVKEYTALAILEFTWYHNGSKVMGKTESRSRLQGRIEILEERSLCINDFSQSFAGKYEARVTRLEFEQYYCAYAYNFSSVYDYEVIADSCSQQTLQAIENYGILAPVTFHISSLGSEVSIAAIEERFTHKKMFFRENGSVSIDAATRLTTIDGIDLRTARLVYKWYFNGSEIYTQSTRNKRKDFPQDIIIGSLAITDDNIASTQLRRTEPGRPQDSGIYELQVFLPIEAVDPDELCDLCTCCDYYRFLTTSDGAGIKNGVLIGSATVELALYGPPQVYITAGNLTLKEGDSTQLNCTVLEAENADSNVIMWKKNNKVLSTLRRYTTSSLNASEYGTYTCIVLNRFGTSEAQIHLAQKVVLQMQFSLKHSDRCIEPQVSYTIVEETLLQQLIATLALVCNCTITTQNLQSTSLMCSEMSKSLIFTAEFVYSNPEGSLTASSLVNLTQEWIKGIRTINGSNLQLDTDCPIQLPNEDVMPPSGCEATENMEDTVEYGVLVIVGASIAGVFAGMLCAGLTAACVISVREKRRKKHTPSEVNNIQDQTPEGRRTGPNNRLPLTPNLAYGRWQIAAVRPGSLTSAATLYDYPEFRLQRTRNETLEESTLSSGYEN